MKQLKTTTFILLFLLLWIPLLQQLTGIFKETRLKGAYVESVMPKFSADSLKTFGYQKQFEKYQNEHFGLRPLFVKLKNTLEYLLFGELSVTDNVLGKNGLIFSRGSIGRTLGIYYNGREQNEATAEKIRFMKEALERRGSHVIVLMAPSKEMVFPEYLPDSYLGQAKPANDYSDLVRSLNRAGVPLLDFCTYFRKMKDTSSIQLFTKTGFHWSVYAASLAEDSLLHFIRPYVKGPMLEYRRVGAEWSDTARLSDADFEDPQNLFISLQQDRYLYPKLEMVKGTAGRKRPKVIIIGDSFFWQIKDQKRLKTIFSPDSKYWYYFASTSFPLNDDAGVPLRNINIIEELETADIVLLSGSMGTFDHFPFGVSDYYYEHIAQQKELIKGIFAYLWDHPEWAKGLPESSRANNDVYTRLVEKEAIKICSYKRTIRLKANNGRFVSADGARNNIAVCDKQKASTWETLGLIPLGGNKYAISSYKNRYFSAELGGRGELIANRPAIRDWEVFTMLELEDGRVAFKAANGKYVSLDETSLQLFAKAASVGPGEKFLMMD
ncbi:MAG: sugar O-acetyltransferase precursor [Bacteroidetes bacterium]|nr:sugar O-acetyltransferase precursor [Bacteroidota bacterium]